MSLPFISYGGSNLVMTLAALGVLLNIFRQAHAHAVRTPLVSPRVRSDTGAQYPAVCRHLETGSVFSPERRTDWGRSRLRMWRWPVEMSP